MLKSCFYDRLRVVVCLFFSLHMVISVTYRTLTFLPELRNFAVSSVYCVKEKGEGPAPQLSGY